MAGDTNSSGGGNWIALLVGGLAVAVVIIAFVLFSNGGGVYLPDSTDLAVDIDLPRPQMPDAPKIPDLPDVPPVGPPSRPQEPAPTN